MDVPDYIHSIRDGDYEKGLQLMYRTNPFPATCGRICTRRCESVCPVGILGEPVAIRSFVHQFGDHVRAASAAGWTLAELDERLIDDAWIARKPKWARFRHHPVSYLAVWRGARA